MSAIHNEYTQLAEFFSSSNTLGIIIGVVIGAAIAKVITSFVDDLLYPCLDFFDSKNLRDQFYVVRNGPNAPYTTLDEARNDDASVICWGYFIKAFLNLIIQTLCLFYFIKLLMHLHKAEQKLVNVNRH